MGRSRPGTVPARMPGVCRRRRKCSGGAQLCDRGRGPARGPALPNSFPWLSANTSVWPDKTQSRVDQQTDPDEVGSLAGELALQGPPRPPGFAQIQPLRHCGLEDECFVQRLLISYSSLRHVLGGGDARMTRGPVGVGSGRAASLQAPLGRDPIFQ